jgi:hypothetical protein
VLRPRIGRNGNDLLISFPSVIGCKYRIECKTVLGPVQQWQPVVTNIQGDGNTITVVLSNSFTEPQRFYRIVVELLP